jgi:hypothetical protein
MSDSFFGDIGDGIANVAGSVGSTISDIGSGISNFLSGGSGTDPSRLISAFRAQGIPPGAEQSSNSGNNVSAQFSSSIKEKDWRVKLSHDMIYTTPVFSPLKSTGGMVWPYLPTITMSGTANYDSFAPAHTNYPILTYKNSQVDDITIAGQFTVQNQDEGRHWLATMHFLRTVTKMYFGQGTNLGNPPPICTLNGYGDFVYKDVSVVVKTFNITLEKDVDYIAVQLITANTPESGKNVSYVPTNSNITVTVAPVYSRGKMKNFDLSKFAAGTLITAPDNKGFL